MTWQWHNDTKFSVPTGCEVGLISRASDLSSQGFKIESCTLQNVSPVSNVLWRVRASRVNLLIVSLSFVPFIAPRSTLALLWDCYPQAQPYSGNWSPQSCSDLKLGTVQLSHSFFFFSTFFFLFLVAHMLCMIRTNQKWNLDECCQSAKAYSSGGYGWSFKSLEGWRQIFTAGIQ